MEIIFTQVKERHFGKTNTLHEGKQTTDILLLSFLKGKN
jgi:hypothetical protein